MYSPVLQTENSYNSEIKFEKIELENSQVMSENVEDEKDFSCELCRKSHTSALYLKAHLEAFHNYTALDCVVCKKRFRNNKLLRRHILRHNSSNDSLELFCNICGKGFKRSRKDNLNRHILEVHGKETYKQQVRGCEYCGDTFAKRSILNNHLMSEHVERTTEDYNKCHKCTKLFRRKHLVRNEINYRFKTHVKSCQPKSEAEKSMPRTCQHCGKIFKFLSTKKQHEARGRCVMKQEPKDPLTCQTCGQTFKTASAQQLHRHRKHRAARVCSECGEQFRRRKEHLRSWRHQGLPKPPRVPTGCRVPKVLREEGEKWREVWSGITRFNSLSREEGVEREECWRRLGEEVLPGLTRPAVEFRRGWRTMEVLTRVEVEEMVARERVTREQMEVVLGVVREKWGEEVLESGL